MQRPYALTPDLPLLTRDGLLQTDPASGPTVRRSFLFLARGKVGMSVILNCVGRFLDTL
ncbi:MULTISPECIES: hypothetical protein [unclassified Azospirillum]|uniref:hypothetical protein n=1 Tax=unclassified Azospirillum TaxID=2630922 RepID=UPI000B6F62E1|nr:MULTISPECIES: hypothetical protein [unclassified Azospirillum]SNT22340.1 hypothetical protein SAMN05880556_1383 [Azospirillum sp. RU38E]SNT33754.1 hypothetical protein SAMN05880591_1389 [Azospirillum sp. RU37A]